MVSIFIVIAVIIVAVAIINQRDKKGSKRDNQQMTYIRSEGKTSNPWKYYQQPSKEQRFAVKSR